MAVNVGCLLNDDIHPRLVFVRQFNVIANTTLSRAVCDKALHSLRIDARHIAHVRITVRVGICARYIVHKLISVLNCHDTSSFYCSATAVLSFDAATASFLSLLSFAPIW